MVKIATEGKGANKIFIWGLCLLCFAIYFNSLNNNFVLDDEILIVRNPLVKSFKFVPLIFQKNIHQYSGITTKKAGKMYRPLQILSYAFDYKIWKLNPFGFHLSNTALHLINSLLIYYLLRKIIFNNTLSKISSLLFLAHPVNTSVVSYISGRADLLSYLFMLLSVIFFLSFTKQKLKTYYAASLFCAALALLSRENALLLFIFITLVLFLNKPKIKDYLYVIPFILLDLSYIALRILIFGDYAIAMPPGFLSCGLRFLNFLNIIQEYLLLLIFPLNLRLFRSTLFITRFLDIRVLMVLMLSVSLIIAVVKFRKNKTALFGILWFFIGLIPVFISMDGYDNFREAVMAESWLYVPSIGFLLALAFFFIKLKRIGMILIVAMSGFFSFLTVTNNLYWKNDFVLHKNILAYTTERNYMRINLVNYYMRYKLYKQALDEIEKFSFYYPDSAHTYFIWGNYYYAAGEFAKAVESYSKVLDRDKNFFYAYHNLGLCYEKLGQTDKAVNLALECFKINPYYTKNLVWLGNLYSKEKKFVQAKKYYNKALEIEPDNLQLKNRMFLE